MKTHDLTFSTDQLSADEDRRNRGIAPERRQRGLDLPGSASVHLIELVNGSVNAEIGEERLNRVAHAATTLAENYHCLFTYHSAYFLHFYKLNIDMTCLSSTGDFCWDTLNWVLRWRSKHTCIYRRFQIDST